MPDVLAYAVALYAIDVLVWGAAGYFAFALCGGRRWWLGIALTSIAYLGAQIGLFLPVLRTLDLRIGDEAVADLLNTDRVVDLITVDPLSDVPLSLFGIAVGFVVAGFLDERARARRAGS